MYKNCPLIVHDREFSVDLIALPFHELDLILGMDWLSKHRAIVDCNKKQYCLNVPTCQRLYMVSDMRPCQI